MSGERIDTLRLVGALGTNKVMLGELSRLGRRAFTDLRVPTAQKHGEGQITYPFHPALAAVAVRYHRTSARILWDVCESRATRLEPLFDDLLKQVASDTRGWLKSGLGFSVQAFRIADFEAGERQVVGVVKNALIDGAKERGISLHVRPTDPDVLFNVRLHDGTLRVSVDLAGRPMNQRGYRLEAGLAPLREDVAANLVMLSRFDARAEMLVDPMSGSGTIAIEAAAMAQALPLWVDHEPLAFRLPAFDSERAQTAAPLFADTRAHILTCEVDEGTWNAQRENVRRAGVGDALDSRHLDFRTLAPADLIAQLPAGISSGLILSNPPYGERVGEQKEVERLYADLGRWCRQLPGWRAGFLVANPRFERCFGGQPRIKKPMKNGPLNGYFLLYDL